MQIINKQQLIDKLQSIKSACPIGMTTVVPINALKKDRISKLPNPYNEIFKVSRVNCFISFDYETSVNNRRIKEGKENDFEVQDRKWGEKIGPNLIKNKDLYYLQCKIQSTRKPIYFFKDSNGIMRIIKKELIENYLPLQNHALNQNLSEEIICRTYKLDNIHQLQIAKESFRLEASKDKE